MAKRMLDHIEAISAAASAVAAFLAIAYAVHQVSESKRVSREATALQAHREYLALCVESPELSSSLMFAKGTVTLFDVRAHGSRKVDLRRVAARPSFIG
ncbi:hypothetical protein [Rhizobium leguminosarum]|uniref:hypothetical protein n=1 Tax=Rhizobium leguminosarum TaxID=384 RepID=UPI0010321F0B|nr:hypothetical protein [Rhizobium leguminosarum]TBG96047.1 hypothetical protein ELG68_35895 [Rhizobium leguminosarum]